MLNTFFLNQCENPKLINKNKIRGWIEMILLKPWIICTCILSFAELNTASHNRSLQDLDKAIARAKAANYDSLLDLQIVMAGRLRDQLHRIEKLRHSVLNMDNRTIAEIRTYGNPPDGVHQSLQAAFLLLGHSKKDVKVGTLKIHLYKCIRAHKLGVYIKGEMLLFFFYTIRIFTKNIK